MERKDSLVRHIDLDQQDEHVKQFVLALHLDADGSVLEVGGKPVARVLPVAGEVAVEREKIKAAILARRDESRKLNAEWEDADRQVWDQIPGDPS